MSDPNARLFDDPQVARVLVYRRLDGGDVSYPAEGPELTEAMLRAKYRSGTYRLFPRNGLGHPLPGSLLLTLA